MKAILLSLLLILTASCASTVKKIKPPEAPLKTYTSPKLHNADCYIDQQRYSEANLLLLEESRNTYKVRAQDGKVLGLPINQCILSQVTTEEGFDSETPGQRWVKCSLGTMSLVTDSLIYVDDEPHFYRLKRKDGQIWMLPREHCAIYPFPPKY